METIWQNVRCAGTLPASWANLSFSAISLAENNLTGSLPPQYGTSWGTITLLYLTSNNLTGSTSARTFMCLRPYESVHGCLCVHAHNNAFPLLLLVWPDLLALLHAHKLW